jgi:hypothetical protein
MKKFSVIPVLIALLLATQVLAGTLTVSGNLTVTTNLTAQSITLGGITETNWAASLAGGYKYVIVAEGTNDLQRGSNLKAAYTTATTLSPTSSNRVAVIVPPGSYNLGGTGLTMNTSYVDLIGLVPAQMTSKQVFTNSAGSLSTKTVANVQCPVLIYASASAGTLVQSVDYVRIESTIFSNTASGDAYSPSVSGTNTILRHVSMSSMSQSGEYAGLYVDCISGGSGFAYFAIVSGAFIECVGGDGSFGADNYGTRGTFIDCTGGSYSFGGNSYPGAGGTFIRCVGGDDAFGGEGPSSGTFINCVGGNNSFSGQNSADGTYLDCIGGDFSFGGAGDAIGVFTDCIGGNGSFGGDSNDGGTLHTTAKLQHCKAGNNSFGTFNVASDDFNYNVGGSNTFLMFPQLPTATNGLPSGTVYNSSGTLKIMP